MDCIVRSWIMGTLSPEMADVVMERDATARSMLIALESQFLGNWEMRALFLNMEFHNFSQGDLSITDYYCSFKSMADSLLDLGEHITDRTLVLNMIRDLNGHFKDIGTNLHRSCPFSTFLQVRSELQLEELHMAKTVLAGTFTTSSAGDDSRSGASPGLQQPPSCSSLPLALRGGMRSKHGGKPGGNGGQGSAGGDGGTNSMGAPTSRAA